MFKKHVISSLFLILASGTASAVDFGIGARVADSYQGTIYLPININNSIRIEPSFTHYKEKEDWDEEGYLSRSDSVSTIELGLFKVFTHQEKLKSYAGIRAGISNISYEWTSRYSETIDYNKRNYDRTIITPTFGFEYFFIPNVSLAGEFGYIYIEGENKSRATYTNENMVDSTASDSDARASGTQTSVIIRYTF